MKRGSSCKNFPQFMLSSFIVAVDLRNGKFVPLRQLYYKFIKVLLSYLCAKETINAKKKPKERFKKWTEV